jgi:hypothetical protein
MQAYSYALELRTELEEWWRSPGGQDFSRGWTRHRRPNVIGAMPPIGDIEQSKLGIAAPFFVTEEMVDLLEHSGKSFPPTEFRREDLPLDHGFVLLARPIPFLDIRKKEYNFSAFSWGLTGPTIDPNDSWGIHLSLYIHEAHDPERADLHDGSPKNYKFPTLALIHETPWRFGNDFLDRNSWQARDPRLDDVPDDVLEGSMATLRAIHAFFILSWQKIATPQNAQADRPVRRRAQRLWPE